MSKDINRYNKNRDYLKRLNYPRQTYAFSGIDWGDVDSVSASIRSKLNINGAPMIISPMPPGSLARDSEEWSQVHGASMDCIMSLIDGGKYSQNITQSNFEFDSVYSRALPTAKNNNIYDVLDNKQQIQFIVGKTDPDEFRSLGSTPLLPSEQRGLGVRAPIQMCGWGHTIGMRPTDPNPQFTRTNDNEHKFDRSSWKVGPLDVRWDERRKCWRGFNDLIADNHEKNLGTFVFSTNPDEGYGFPFLRGKLEDVWIVRKTWRDDSPLIANASRVEDTTKSGTLITKLASYAIKDNIIAQWSDVLTTSTACLNPVYSATLGSETTKDGYMCINTSANFTTGPGANKTGPISFSLVPPENVQLGEMYYQGDGPCGSWVPGVEIDICKWGQNELGTLYANDKTLLDGIITLCNLVGGAKDLKKLIKRNTDWIVDDIDLKIEHGNMSKIMGDGTSAALNDIEINFQAVETWSQEILANINKEIADATTTLMISALNSVQGALDSLALQLTTCINDGWVYIAAQLLENCSCSITPPVCDVSAPAIQPALGITTNVDPPYQTPNTMTPWINAIDAAKEQIVNGVVNPLNDLKGEIQAAAVSDEIVPATPGLILTVDDPCGSSSHTNSC